MTVRNRYSLLILVSGILCLILFNCSRLDLRDKSVAPLNVVLLDKSRVDNAKVRHIFNAVFLKTVVEKGRGIITVFDFDTLGLGETRLSDVNYLIYFDIMNYNTTDIENNMESILVSAKIVNPANRSVIDSYVENAKGGGIDRVCTIAADKLGNRIIKKLTAMVHKTPTARNSPIKDSL
jgi:hypothetical protein